MRHHEGEAFVVGWIPTDGVKAYATQRLRGGWGGGSGFGSGSSSRIEPTRGTRLVPTDSEEVIGVITRTRSVPCVRDCDGPNPHVRLWACSRMVTLRAVDPAR